MTSQHNAGPGPLYHVTCCPPPTAGTRLWTLGHGLVGNGNDVMRDFQSWIEIIEVDEQQKVILISRLRKIILREKTSFNGASIFCII